MTPNGVNFLFFSFLAVYFTQHWLPSHAGSTTSSGQQGAAPSSLSKDKSHFSTDFELLGRTGEWNAATQQGIATWSYSPTQEANKGVQHSRGTMVKQKGVVPLTETAGCIDAVSGPPHLAHGALGRKPKLDVQLMC